MKRTLRQLKKYLNLLFLLAIALCSNTFAQELNCDVTLNTEQIADAAFNYVDTEFEPALEGYINEHSWTNDEFLEQERIDCRIEIIFVSGNNNFEFNAQIIVAATRPIYNTTQRTTSVLIRDDLWSFAYPQGTNLIHDDLQFDALTSLIDFYAYIILGYDYDSFAELGGTPQFQKAQNVLDLAQNTSATGWSRNTNNQRNRYFLINDLLNPSYEDLRRAYYTYHRLGLDQFTADTQGARQQVLNAIKMIEENKTRTTNNYLYDIFFDAKSKEITSIFIDAETRIRLEAFSELRQVDQGHLSDYQALQN